MPSPPAMATPPTPLQAVASESFLLVNSHSRHFLALSLLFLLPPSFASFSLSAASSRTPFHTQSLLLFRMSPLPRPPRHHPLSLSVALFFVSLVFAVLAACSVTHSALRAFYGRPVKLLSSLRSTVYNYLRMVATLSVSLSPFLLPAAVLFLSDYLLSRRPSSPHLAALSIAASIVALAVAAYSQIIWSLAAVVVVAESKWGFCALRRSGYLIGGMKMLALKLNVLFSALFGGLLWLGSMSAEAEERWIAVVVVVAASSGVMAVAIMGLAAAVVLYMYCRAAKGELVTEIAEEFATEYVCLPFDEGKVPRLISILHPE